MREIRRKFGRARPIFTRCFRIHYNGCVWGHAASSLDLDIAMCEGIKKVVFMHHDPVSSDQHIAEAAERARLCIKMQKEMTRKTDKKLFDVKWAYAYDGMEIEI